ncbi:hypothetical protein RclHR1_19270005 [Rhizophagus clarus]|uniref:Uncharacterized protein n=1 Tax=Rhizophagus clarus TaxID=94130 RepID=A0A2Z6QNE5_9GLOM|nr:hypothetical protein RclHR1_19270005 [Rhizophagus clarus]GES96478.1 hypothetical protein RCL_jg14506.t1 [Rhizophagus clarus]
MSSTTSNTTADFIKTALFEEYYDCFNTAIAGSNWFSTHSLLFVKNNEEETSQKKDKQKAEFVKQVISNIMPTTPSVPNLTNSQPIVISSLSSNFTLKPDAKSVKKVKNLESDPDATHIITGY